jgi:hypothetical protein
MERRIRDSPVLTRKYHPRNYHPLKGTPLLCILIATTNKNDLFVVRVPIVMTIPRLLRHARAEIWKRRMKLDGWLEEDYCSSEDFNIGRFTQQKILAVSSS